MGNMWLHFIDIDLLYRDALYERFDGNIKSRTSVFSLPSDLQIIYVFKWLLCLILFPNKESDLIKRMETPFSLSYGWMYLFYYLNWLVVDNYVYIKRYYINLQIKIKWKNGHCLPSHRRSLNVPTIINFR